MPYPNYSLSTKKEELTGIYANFSRDDANKIWQTFKLPASSTFVDHLRNILPLFHRFCCELVPAKNSYQRKQQEELSNLIELLFNNKAITTSGATIEENITRRDLHDYLTEYPLFSTLVLIAENHYENESEYEWWTLLTARIYLLLPEDLYTPLLALDKTRVLNINISTLTKHLSITGFYALTNFELKAQLINLNYLSLEFDTLSNYFVRKERKKKKLKSSLQCLTSHPFEFRGDQLQECQFIDESGEVQQSNLTLTPKSALSKKSQQQRYRNKVAGIKSAFRRQNLNLALSQKTLTPLELKGFLIHSFAQLIDNELDLITQKNCWYWIIFFLELWLDLPYSQIKSLMLFNQRSKKKLDKDAPRGLYYHLTNDGHCHTYFVITQRLVKGKQASTALNAYYQSINDTPAVLIVPYPLQHLFYAVLKSVIPSKRHARSLMSVSNIDEQKYNTWLKQNIKTYNSDCCQHVKGSQIRSSFHHYLADRIPDTYLGWQQSYAKMQHYYTNADVQIIQYTLHNQWLVFLKEIGITQEVGSMLGSDELSNPGAKNNYQSFGAALSLKQEQFTLLANYFVKACTEKTQLRRNELNNDIENISQLIACYIALRSNLVGGLRPVIHPFPTLSATSLAHCIFTTQDKDAHKNGEHRLIFIDNNLSELWQHWLDWFYKYEQLNRFNQPSLAYLSDGQRFEMNKEALQKIFTKLNIQLDPNSFRQSLCTQWIDNDLYTETPHGFNQQQLNLQMNHFKIGQSPLGQYSLCSPMQMAKRQAGKLSSLMVIFDDSDKTCLTLIKKLIQIGLGF